MLSRKYYSLIASVIKESETKDELIEKLCREFRADNPNFDTYRFKEASKSEVEE